MNRYLIHEPVKRQYWEFKAGNRFEFISRPDLKITLIGKSFVYPNTWVCDSTDGNQAIGEDYIRKYYEQI